MSVLADNLAKIMNIDIKLGFILIFLTIWLIWSWVIDRKIQNNLQEI